MKAISERLKIEVDYEATHKGLQVDKDGWMHDEWRVTINGQAVQYRTGIGHRKIKPPQMRKWSKNVLTCGRWADTEAHMLAIIKDSKPMPPSVDDVLYSLHSDYQCGNMSFSDFCMELDYNEDSIKDRETYFSCQKSGQQLLFMDLGKSMDEIAEAFQDY